MHQKQQEKTDQLLLQIQQCEGPEAFPLASHGFFNALVRCKEQQDSLERENVALKQAWCLDGPLKVLEGAHDHGFPLVTAGA